MADGITIQTHGDYGPFSTMGKSIGYQVTIGKSSYLVDCGSPVFQQIGIHKIENIKGLLVTHCHDDHKRWFTDLALFYRYTFGVSQRIFFLTSERVNEEISRASGPALDKSLSYDSKSVIDIAYGEYVDYRMIGPQAKYRIVAKNEGEVISVDFEIPVSIFSKTPFTSTCLISGGSTLCSMAESLFILRC